ncbi:MAG: nucleotidyltransferase domain-containing protein [Thermoproteota archaeon]
MSERPWVSRYMVERLRMLGDWRRYARIIAKAACQVIPGARTYVFGSAASGNLTSLSDVDVLVELPREVKPLERLELKLSVFEKAVELGLPWDYPVDLHVAGPAEAAWYKGRSKIVEIWPDG